MKINRIDRDFVERYKLSINSQQINDFFKTNKKGGTIRDRLPAKLDDFVRIIM